MITAKDMAVVSCKNKVTKEDRLSRLSKEIDSIEHSVLNMAKGGHNEAVDMVSVDFAGIVERYFKDAGFTTIISENSTIGHKFIRIKW